MPQLGESIAEATIVRLNVRVGDTVEADQEVLEVETNKATMGVTTMCGGVVIRIDASEGEVYPVGSILGMLEVAEEEAIRTGVLSEEPAPAGEPEPAGAGVPDEAGPQPHEKTPELPPPPKPGPVSPTVQGLPVPAGIKGAHYISPRMRARMDELGLRASDISAIVGSGAGGRVTVEDLEKFLDYISEWPSQKASSMRLSVADAMRRSWTRPLASVGLPVFLDKLLDYRSRQDPKPPLTLYLLCAFGKALAADPATAGYLIGQNVVHPRSFDIGVAVQADDGVLVPVLREVDRKSAVELLDDYLELVAKARERRLPEEHRKGGIATVTNFGTFGLVSGTPIPLPNETLILGIGAGRKKPEWNEVTGCFEPVTEAELVLTFDHRVVDGGGAGVLLNRLSEHLQVPEGL
jgi:pyruvate/2-oxoglutarate dehydrogenase complex dihydrolipoamide acyltransferase (E2) component